MPKLRLFKRAEIWVPTWCGWICLLSVPSVCVVAMLVSVYPFLNVNRPIGGEYLVAEGWMNKRALGKAAELFREGGYREMIVTGGRISEASYLREFLPQFETEAEVGANQLRSLGISPVHAVPRPSVSQDRTYTSGLALTKWLTDTGRRDVRLDIVSTGPHSRRSLMLFKIALGDVAEVGILGLTPQGYDPERWWTTSSGVRTMIGEFLAYGYAKFLFYPNPQKDLLTLFKEGS
jgi:hypothetical protein